MPKAPAIDARYFGDPTLADALAHHGPGTLRDGLDALLPRGSTPSGPSLKGIRLPRLPALTRQRTNAMPDSFADDLDALADEWAEPVRAAGRVHRWSGGLQTEFGLIRCEGSGCWMCAMPNFPLVDMSTFEALPASGEAQDGHPEPVVTPAPPVRATPSSKPVRKPKGKRRRPAFDGKAKAETARRLAIWHATAHAKEPRA